MPKIEFHDLDIYIRNEHLLSLNHNFVVVVVVPPSVGEWDVFILRLITVLAWNIKWILFLFKVCNNM